jgi:hypothetical protein
MRPAALSSQSDLNTLAVALTRQFIVVACLMSVPPTAGAKEIQCPPPPHSPHSQFAPKA